MLFLKRVLTQAMIIATSRVSLNRSLAELKADYAAPM
jgi:hypothetical protein